VEAPPTLTATTAATAAALAATTRIGRFEEKWRSARLARGRIDGLLNDVVKHEPDLDAILDELTEVVQTHDDIIVKPMSALAG
jgi:hypothetical protein